jgi:hypothetical protein
MAAVDLGDLAVALDRRALTAVMRSIAGDGRPHVLYTGW